jgi:hypothetical protein
MLLGNGSVKTLPRNEEFLETFFSVRSLSYQRKVGDQFFAELVVPVFLFLFFCSFTFLYFLLPFILSDFFLSLIISAYSSGLYLFSFFHHLLISLSVLFHCPFLFLLPFPLNVLLFRPIYIVAYLLRARTVEPEQQSLLANGSETFVSRQRLGKHVPAATDTHLTIDVLLEMVFSIRSVRMSYKKDKWGNQVSSVRQAVTKRFQLEGCRRSERT